MQVTEKPVQKEICLMWRSLGVGGLQARHGQALAYFSAFPLVLSSSSCRLIVSSENMAVSGGRKPLISGHFLKALH